MGKGQIASILVIALAGSPGWAAEAQGINGCSMGKIKGSPIYSITQPDGYTTRIIGTPTHTGQQRKRVRGFVKKLAEKDPKILLKNLYGYKEGGVTKFDAEYYKAANELALLDQVQNNLRGPSVNEGDDLVGRFLRNQRGKAIKAFIASEHAIKASEARSKANAHLSEQMKKHSSDVSWIGVQGNKKDLKQTKMNFVDDQFFARKIKKIDLNDGDREDLQGFAFSPIEGAINYEGTHLNMKDEKNKHRRRVHALEGDIRTNANHLVNSLNKSFKKDDFDNVIKSNLAKSVKKLETYGERDRVTKKLKAAQAHMKQAAVEEASGKNAKGTLRERMNGNIKAKYQLLKASDIIDTIRDDDVRFLARIQLNGASGYEPSDAVRREADNYVWNGRQKEMLKSILDKSKASPTNKSGLVVVGSGYAKTLAQDVLKACQKGASSVATNSDVDLEKLKRLLSDGKIHDLEKTNQGLERERDAHEAVWNAINGEGV